MSRGRAFMRGAMGRGGALLLLVGLAAVAGDKYDLRLHLRQGQSWNFDNTFESVQKTHLSVPDHPPVETEQRLRTIRKGRMTVLEVSDGVPTAVRVFFDPASATETEQEGTLRTIDYPFAGMTVTVKRLADGRITEEFDPKLKRDPDPAQRRELESCLGGNDDRPAHPVAVGEQWQPDLELLKQTYRLTDQDSIASSSKLEAISTLNGQRAAEVSTSSAITKHQDEMTMTEEIKGSFRLDLETGALVQSTLDGTSTAKGYQISPGLKGDAVRVQVDNSGKTKTRLVTSAAKAAPSSPAPAPAPAKPANPLAANPLAEPPPAPPAPEPWAGTYKDPQITLELKATDSGAFEGSILFKDQKFPVTARADGSQLKGQFQSGGEAFEFTATRDGKTVSLTTGGKTYQLKKPGINPLGGGS